MEFMTLLLQRKVIITLAVIGALIATVGSILMRKNISVNPRVARIVLRTGYALSWGSIATFIIAGLLGY